MQINSQLKAALAARLSSQGETSGHSSSSNGAPPLEGPSAEERHASQKRAREECSEPPASIRVDVSDSGSTQAFFSACRSSFEVRLIWQSLRLAHQEDMRLRCLNYLHPVSLRFNCKVACSVTEDARNAVAQRYCMTLSMKSVPPLQVSIGRLSDNSITLGDNEVSGHHVALCWEAGCRCWQVCKGSRAHGCHFMHLCAPVSETSPLVS